MNSYIYDMKHRFFAALMLSVIASAGVPGETPWRRLVHEDVALYCRENDMKNGQRIVEIIDRAFPRILESLNLEKPDSLTVFLASTREEFRGLTQGLIPDWSGGAADPARSVLYLQSPRFADPDGVLDQVVVHELAHAVMGMAAPGPSVERWFEEGFAMREAEEGGFGGTVRLWWAFIFGEAVPLAEIDDVLQFDRGKAALAYQESLSAVQYLVERFGRETIADVVMALRSGKPMDEAVSSVTGMRMDAFESEWFRTVKRKSGFVLLLDFSFFVSAVFVVLFFAALVRTRIRTGRIKKEWEIDIGHLNDTSRHRESSNGAGG